MTARHRAGRHAQMRARVGFKLSSVGIETGALTFSHSLWTSDSASCLQVIKLSIQPSSVGMVVGSRGGAAGKSAGTRPTSSMFVSMVKVSMSMRRRGCLAREGDQGRGVVDGAIARGRTQ